MKKVVKNTNKKDEKMNRYLGALNEIHGETLKGIREGSIVVNRKLDKITETLSEHTKILDKHTEILSEHTKKLDSHTEMIGTLMVDMTIVKEDLSVIKSDLKKKVDYDEFQSLVKRVQKIEAKI
ncbi:MAG: hypothetical protein NTZ87_03095 [Candidatus Nomurabacteria bacterium]|nr:hypothetical protein [Candidatus Nomurabacteria bacterium]